MKYSAEVRQRESELVGVRTMEGKVSRPFRKGIIRLYSTQTGTEYLQNYKPN